MELLTQNVSNFYLYIAIFATVFFIIKLFLFAGNDFGMPEVHCDTGGNVFETEDSFNFLSLQAILAFLMGFGWMGLACVTQFKFSNTVSLLGGLVIGALFMYLAAKLMYQIKKLNCIPKSGYDGAIGKEGKSYTIFKPNGKGQVQIEINGKLATVSAVNNTNEEIASFAPIKVVKVENDILFIEKAGE